MSIGFSRWPAKPLARSQATPPSSASALKATTGIADVRGPVREFPGGVRTVHVRQPEIHQDDAWKMLIGERHRFGTVRGFERPEAGCAQHIAR